MRPPFDNGFLFDSLLTAHDIALGVTGLGPAAPGGVLKGRHERPPWSGAKKFFTQPSEDNMLCGMPSTPKTGKKLSFNSTLDNWAQGMDYCAIPVPANITESLGTKGAVLVMARINESEPFKVSLFPVGGGKHYIRVRKKVRNEANLSEGDPVIVQITVLNRADIETPKDLSAALRSKKATTRFSALTPGKKNYIIRRIEDASKPDTRAKRVREAVEDICRTEGKGAI